MATSYDLLKHTKVVWWGPDPDDLNDHPKLFTFKDYENLDKFKTRYTPLQFTITSPEILLMYPNIHQEFQQKRGFLNDSLKFEVTAFVTLHFNRFWRPHNTKSSATDIGYMRIEYQGIDRRDFGLVNFETLLGVMFEMAMYHFGYKFSKMPHAEFSDENYIKYKEYINEIIENADSEGRELIKVESSSNIKQVLLAVKYLHYVEFFKNASPTVLMANEYLIEDIKLWLQFTNQELSNEEMEVIKKRTNTLKTTLSRIDSRFLNKLPIKGIAGGRLTTDAHNIYKDWLAVNGVSNKLVGDKWVIDGTTGINEKREKEDIQDVLEKLDKLEDDTI